VAALRTLLENHGRVEPRQRRAADIVPHIDAAEAERRGLAQRLDRKDRLLVPLARMGHHLGARELARRRLEGLLLLAEGEVHGWSHPTAPPTDAVAIPAERGKRGADTSGDAPAPSNPAARSGSGRSRRSRRQSRRPPASISPTARAATGGPNGRGGWCARTCSPPTT